MRAMALVGLLILSRSVRLLLGNLKPARREYWISEWDIDSIPIEEIPNIPQHGFWILTREYPCPLMGK